MGKAQGLAAIFTLCLMHLGAQAYNLLAQSSVQICPKNGSAAELKCDAKIVVTVTVAGDEVGDADPIVLDRVRDEESGVLKDLQTAIQIKISKSQVRLFYALHYEQDYWFAPSEDVYKDYNDCTCNTENPHSVPCGVIYDNFGNAVPYSCGKCCAQKRDCRPKDHDGDTYCRGQMTSHHSKVASCLNNPGSGGDQYSAFSVNTPKKDFTISITILGPGTHQSVLTLSPSILVQKDGKGIVLATLTGEFASFQSPLQFDDQFLVVPVPKDTFSPTVEAQARLEWLMLSKDKFGRELGKIGFTYEAFFSQQAFCQQPKGSGIGGQLVNYVEEDMANEVSGRELKYSVLRYKDIIGGDAKADPRLWNALWFNCTGCGQSVVTMEIAADSIAFLPSVAPGKIIAAHVPNFVALSFQSIASVTIQNVGTIAAGFSLSTACDKGIVNPQGLQFSLDPNAQQTFNMSLRTTMSNVNVTQDTFQCAITLLDSRAGLVDNRTVSFTISSTVRTNGSDEVLLGPSTIVDPYDKKSSGLFNFGFFDCSKHCVDPKDGTMCYILHLCFKKIMGLFAGVVTTIIAVIVLLVLWRLGILTGLCRLLSGCCKSCCKGRGKGRSDRKRRHGKGAKQKAKKRKGRKKIKKNHGRSKHDSEVGDEDEEKKPKQGTGIPEGEEGELPADVENPASKLEEVAGVAERPDSGKKVAKPGTDVTQKVLEKGKESLQGLGGKMFKGFKGMFKGAKAGANSPPLQEPPPNAPPTPTVDTASPTPPLSTSPLGATAAAPGQQPPPPPPMPLQPAAAAAAAAPAPAQPGPQTVYLAPPPIQTTPQAQIIYASPGPQPQPQPQLQFQAPPGPPRAQFGPPQPPQYAPSSAWPPQFAATQPPMRPLLPPQGRGFPPGFNPMGAPLAQSGPPPQFRAPPPGQPQMPPSGAFRPQFAAGPPRPQFPTDLMSMQPPQPRPGNYGQPSQQQQFGTLQGMRPPPGGPQPWPAAPQGMSQLRPAAPPQGLFTFQAGAPLAPLAPGTQQLRPPGARPLGPPPGFPFMRPNDRG